MNMQQRSQFILQIFGLVLAILICSPIMAHHCQGAHANQEGCGGGGGGGGGDPVPVNIIDAGWAGAGAEDLLSRECTTDEGALSPTGGIYDCDPVGEVQFNLAAGRMIGRKGDARFCDNFFNARTFSNGDYRLYYSGDCTVGPGSCTIGILNTSHEHDIAVANGWPADVGLLIIRAQWNIPEASSGPNPWLDAMVLDEPNWFTVDFNQAGGNKKLASCEYDPLPGEAVFVSVPQ